MATSTALSILTLLLVISSVCNVEGLETNYYATSCPSAEATIAKIVRNAIQNDKRVGAAMIRLLFHDCFVEGCDASVLIDDPNSNAEKDATPNLNLHNLDLIDQAKAAVEKLCKQTVSCADIVAFAASTSLSTLGGPKVDLQGGRFDGLVSSKTEALQNIPSPFSNISTLQTQFNGKGLDANDLVALSGSHTVGKAHCGAFAPRLRNFSSTDQVDPSLDPTLANSLQSQCPVNPPNTTIVSMDVKTPTLFDNRYFQGVQSKKGLFISDAQLYNDTDTKALVDRFAGDNALFESQFAASVKKMSNIELKTSANGNIRTNCRSFT